jgi:hypothetical protein
MSEKDDFAKGVPKEAWTAATDVIKELLSPLTATTVGISKLIEQKFSTLNEVQKIIAEKTIKEAIIKAEKAKIQDHSNVVVKPQVIYIVLENADSQSDDAIRDLWSNLTARELTEGSVHPEIARLFGKLTAPDLMILSNLYVEQSSVVKFILKALASAYTLGILNDAKSFNHVFLKELGLIEDVSGKWFCTIKGKELVRSIDSVGKLGSPN